MKTIEKKAKAYDEALERARYVLHTVETAGCAMHKDLLTEIFSELESEDEKIRKGLIKMLERAAGSFVFEATGIKKDALLAYLEKQKEQKPEFISISEMVSKYRNTDEYDGDGNYKGKPVNCMIRAYEQGIRDTLSKVKEQKPAITKPHKGDDGNPYDMGVSEAQEYAIKRGFGIPFNDGEVFVDERYITQTIGNILRWADEHPKEQKPAWSEEDEKNMATMIEILNIYQRLYDGGIITSIDDRREFLKRMIELSNWLKSLRPSWKPTTEQIGMVTRVCNGLHMQNSFEAEGMDVLLKQLEKIFWNTPDTEQEEHWKPTQEQIGALNYAYCELFKREDVGNNILGPLQKLLDDLKKL